MRKAETAGAADCRAVDKLAKKTVKQLLAEYVTVLGTRRPTVSHQK